MTSFGRTKLNALSLGVVGFGVLAQFQNLISFLSYLAPLGLPTGLTKFVSDFNVHDTENINHIFNDSLKLLLLSFVFFLVLIVPCSEFISIWLFNDSSYQNIIILIGFLNFFIIFYQFFDAFLKGIKKINLYIKISIISSCISFAFSIPAIIYLRLLGAVLSSLLLFIVFTIVSIVQLKKNNLFPVLKFDFTFKFHNKKLVKEIMSIGVVHMVSTTIFQYSLLLIRKITLDSLGAYNNGILQSVFAISVNYFGILFISLWTYIFPKINEYKTSDELNKSTNQNLRYVTIIISISIIFIYLFKEFFVKILYSQDFSQSVYLYKYQFLGDFFRALSWIFALWLLPKMKIKIYFILDTTYNFLLLGIYFLSLTYIQKDIVFFSISYMIANFIHMILNFIMYKKYNYFTFQKKNLFLVLASLVLIISCFWVCEVYSNLKYFIVFIMIFGWFILIINTNEKEIIKNYIKK